MTLDVSATTTQPRSVYECSNVIDVALFTEPEEVYLVSYFLVCHFYFILSFFLIIFLLVVATYSFYFFCIES